MPPLTLIPPGTRFARLVVQELVAERRHGKACYRCLCDCGREIITVGNRLKCGNTKSCGCLKRGDAPDCSEPGCSRAARYRGLCERHWVPLPKLTAENRFRAKYVVDEGTGCWVWTAGRTEDGYGEFRAGGRRVLAHRHAYTTHVGPILDDLYVLHHCDNPPCVNPDHLYLGTQFDNMQDMIARSRMPSTRGERNGRALLTEEQVQLIRSLHAPGQPGSRKRMAERFGVSESTVDAILQGRNWRHVT